MTFKELKKAAEIYKEIDLLAEWYDFTPEVMDAITKFVFYSVEKNRLAEYSPKDVATSIRLGIEREWENREEPHKVVLVFMDAKGFWDTEKRAKRLYPHEPTRSGGATLRIFDTDCAEFSKQTPPPCDKEVTEDDGTVCGALLSVIRATAPDGEKGEIRMFRNFRRVE